LARAPGTARGLRGPRRSASVARVYAAGERADDAVLLAPPEPLTLDAVARIAAGAPVTIGDGVRNRLEASHAQLVALARSGRTVYGLSTGCGPLCDRRVSPVASSCFQRNLVRSHASGLCPRHRADVSRGAMAVSASCPGRPSRRGAGRRGGGGGGSRPRGTRREPRGARRARARGAAPPGSDRLGGPPACAPRREPASPRRERP